MRECNTCPFSGRKKIKSKGEGRNGIGLILPFPSKADSERNDIFIDSYSSLTIAFLHKAGIRIEETKVIPLCSCPSSGDKYEERDAFFSCRYRFKEDIKGLKLLILLGQEVSDALGLEGKIEDIRGSVYFNEDEQILLPTYDPKKVLPFTTHRDDANVPAKIIWQADFEKAKELVEEDFKGLKEDFNLFPSYEEVETFINTAVQKKSLIAVDIETTGFDPSIGEPICIGLADSKETGICIPFLQQGGGRYFTQEEEARVKKLLEKLFTYGNLAYQNALFDVPYLRKKGFNHPYHSIKQDTMLLHHCLNSELPHDLAFIVSLYGRTPYWKSLMRDKVGSNLNQDDKLFRTYNLRDCVVIHQILPPMLKELKELKQEHIYFGESIPLISPIGKMKEYGINFDQKAAKEFQKEVETDLKKIETEIRQLTKVPKEFNFSSDEDLRYLFFGIIPNKFKELENLKYYSESSLPEGKKVRQKETKIYKGLLALQRIKDETIPLLSAPLTSKKTDGGKVPVNQEALLSTFIKLEERLEKIALFRNQEKFLEEKIQKEKAKKVILLFMEFAKVEKLLSTYTKFPVRKDGRLYPSYLIHGTNTGRLSSKGDKVKGKKEDGLNFQNLPKKDLRVRKVFIPTKGNCFLSLDYKNLEVVVLTYITGDKIYEVAFKEGQNIHELNIKVLFPQAIKGSKDWDMQKRAAKIFFFGGISYGGGAKEIYRKVKLEVPELPITFQQFEQAINNWFRVHTDYAVWKEKVQNFALEQRLSFVFNGRRRELLGSKNDILKQALNNPSQGGAAHIINQATIRVDKRFEDEKIQSLLIGQIHDQLIVDTKLNEIKNVKTIMVEEMERPVMIDGIERVFKVDPEAGWSLGTLKKYDEFLKEIK